MTNPDAVKLYAERDTRKQGQTYCDHINAMTGESLHSKSDIAAELAHRDILLIASQQEIERLRKTLTTSYDLLEESISDTKQYDFEVRARASILSSMAALKDKDK